MTTTRTLADSGSSTSPTAPAVKAHSSVSTVQQGINEYWSRWAPDYEAHQRSRLELPGEAQAWKRVWASGLPQQPTQVLDVGTGSGHAALLVAELGHQVIGIDLAEGMLHQARRKAVDVGSPQFHRGDATAPDFPARSFGAITARYVLWTLRQPQQALANWRELLCPGGKLVVVDSLWFPQGIGASGSTGDDDDRSEHFRNAYAPATAELPVAEATEISAFAQLIAQAGFTDVTVDELPEIYELDSQRGVAAGHQLQMQYRLTATAP